MIRWLRAWLEYQRELERLVAEHYDGGHTISALTYRRLQAQARGQR